MGQELVVETGHGGSFSQAMENSVPRTHIILVTLCREKMAEPHPVLPRKNCVFLQPAR